jgi:hypothetical protein
MAVTVILFLILNPFFSIFVDGSHKTIKLNIEYFLSDFILGNFAAAFEIPHTDEVLML